MDQRAENILVMLKFGKGNHILVSVPYFSYRYANNITDIEEVQTREPPPTNQFNHREARLVGLYCMLTVPHTLTQNIKPQSMIGYC